MRTITSPGVQVNEIDNSLRVSPTNANTAIVLGFTNSGPVNTPIEITSTDEYKKVFGVPTTDAERYHYHTVAPILNGGSSVLSLRLPYGDETQPVYSLLAYPGVNISSRTGTDYSFYLDRHPQRSFTPADLTTYDTSETSITRYEDHFKITETAAISAHSLSYNFSAELIPADGSRFLTIEFKNTSNRIISDATISVSDGGVADVQGSSTITNLDDGWVRYIFEFDCTDPIYDGLTLNELTIYIKPGDELTLIYEGDPLVDIFIRKAELTYELPEFDNLYDDVVLLSKPTHIILTEQEYYNIKQYGIEWWDRLETKDNLTKDTLGGAAMIILNKRGTTISKKNTGFYVGLVDNTNLNIGTQNNDIRKIATLDATSATTNIYPEINTTRLEFSLSSDNTKRTIKSISSVLDNLTDINLSSNTFDDTLCIGIFDIDTSNTAADAYKLKYNLAEKVVGSIDPARRIQSSVGDSDVTFSLERIAEQNDITEILINKYVSGKEEAGLLDNDGLPRRKIRIASTALQDQEEDGGSIWAELYTIYNEAFVTLDEEQIEVLAGEYRNRVGFDVQILDVLLDNNLIEYIDGLYPIGIYDNIKPVTNIPSKINKALQQVEDRDAFNSIYILPEAGLGTIHCATTILNKTEYNDAIYTNISDLLKVGTYTPGPVDVRGIYTSVASELIRYAEQRKDVLVVLDPLRHILVQNDNQIYQKSSNYSFTSVASGLRHQFELLNTSYALVIANWVKVSESRKMTNFMWVPTSGHYAARTFDIRASRGIWYPIAGFNYGNVTGVLDIAIKTDQAQRDILYRDSINTLDQFTSHGFVIMGQKTLLRQPSTFDRVNTRVIFSYISRTIDNSLKYFVFENNTPAIRVDISNTIEPFLSDIKRGGGIYEYRVICDNTNNTPTNIDNNEIIVDVLISPTKTSEFIILNFYLQRTNS